MFATLNRWFRAAIGVENLSDDPEINPNVDYPQFNWNDVREAMAIERADRFMKVKVKKPAKKRAPAKAVSKKAVRK